MKRDIHRLIKECTQKMQERGHCAMYIRSAKNTWEQLLVPFMEKMGTRKYSPDVGKAFICSLEATSSHCANWRKAQQRYIRYLDDVMTLGHIRSRFDEKPAEVCVAGLFGNHVKQFC